MKKIGLIFWFIFFLYYPLTAQKVFSEYPFQFDQYIHQYNIINPALVTNKNPRFIQIGYNGFNQLSNNIATYYANVNYALGPDSSTRKNAIGFYTINEKEGEYLNRLKVLAQYAYKVYIYENTILTSGLSFGFVNNSLKPNPAVGGESSYKADADIGLSLIHKELTLGVAINQLFANNIRFLNGTYSQKRHFTFISSYSKSISPFIQLKSDIYYRTGKYYFNKYALSMTAIYQKVFSLGIMAKSGNGIIQTIGIQGIKVNKNELGLLFSFRFPTSKAVLAQSGNFEIMMEYKF